ncbi:hypothetical protein FB451DRAFT_1362049 [Mycena latifolia]|nr:hypothetical protein FB451DRAFT_1362049 [Mycena latifolia]
MKIVELTFPSASGKTTKRRKVAAAPKDAVPQSAENTFAGMPLDIILEFLRFMSPAELLAMRDVNKGFRRMLDSGEKATAIWVNSREYHGIPKPFEGFTERAWARFIFGRICQECEENEAREPDFGLMMRLCIDCRTDKITYVPASLCQELDFSVESDEEDFMGPVLEFEETFPHSNWYETRDEIFSKDYRKEQHWWAPYLWDILPIVRSDRRGRASAEKKLAKLHEEGERRLKHSKICDAWRDRVEAEERQAKLEILNAKFKALGYQDPELDGLDNRKMLARFDLPITEQAWEVIRADLEGSIKDKRRHRLFKDHPDIMKDRKILAREAFMTYARTVLPTEATYLPTVAGLKAIPEIRAICEREPDVDVTITDFADLPSILVNWVSLKRASLTRLANSTVPEGTSNRFNLASTIFRCEVEHDKLGRPAMFGGDEAMRHVGESCDPQLDIGLSKIASALVVSLGLDPDTTSVADMDSHTARFRCEGRVDYADCGKNHQWIKVFTWRGCVTHAIEVHQYGSEKPSWQLDADGYYKNGNATFVAIPEDPAARIRGPFNDTLPTAESSSWVCGHCTVYVCGPETLQGVTAHVNTVHGKTEIGTLDILLAPGVLSISKTCYSLRRPEAVVAKPVAPKPVVSNSRQPEAQHSDVVMLRCFRCDNSRLFRGSRPVGDHLKGKHQILNPVRDVDYGDPAAEIRGPFNDALPRAESSSWSRQDPVLRVRYPLRSRSGIHQQGLLLQTPTRDTYAQISSEGSEPQCSEVSLSPMRQIEAIQWEWSRRRSSKGKHKILNAVCDIDYGIYSGHGM